MTAKPYDWDASDAEAASIGYAARDLPADDTVPNVDAALRNLEQRAVSLGYADRMHGGDGRTWTNECAGVWCHVLNEGYDLGMTRYDEAHST